MPMFRSPLFTGHGVHDLIGFSPDRASHSLSGRTCTHTGYDRSFRPLLGRVQIRSLIAVTQPYGWLSGSIADPTKRMRSLVIVTGGACASSAFENCFGPAK